jgi:SAM-dependent methyltransferase
MTTNMKTSTLSDPFFREYTSQDAILKYTRATAGYGIGYLLDHDYKAIYLKALESLPPEMKRTGIRILEFGCGGGMNLVHLISVLEQGGVRVEAAVGTDFSPVLIEAARREAQNYLRKDEASKVAFHVAKNETLIQDLTASAGAGKGTLANSFHLILGVNTMRYCHRAGKQLECARDILDLLVPGGVCVNIDMNDRFPFFRSAMKTRLTGQNEAPEECYLPSLSEYTDPFKSAGFDVLRSEHFSWVPHSTGAVMSRLLAGMTPVLNAVARSRAMRSLVVAKKPAKAGKP